MWFGILGPLLVRDGDRVAAVPAARQRVLLAALLVRAGTVVPAGSLAELVWDGAPPDGAAATLRSHVMRLRRALGPGPGDRVMTRPPGYLVEASADEVDAALFARLSRAGGEAVRAGAWERAYLMLGEALALWRGDPLSDVPAPLLLRDELPGLEQARLQALEWRADAGLALGRHADLIPELQLLAARHPLRERFHVQLMTALAQCGRTAEALAAYQHARGTLIAELGADPGPELQRAHRKLLTGAPAGPEAAPPAGGPPPAVRCSLPPDTAAFTGRDAELDRIASAMAGAGEAAAIHAIDGMPGIGKSALAVRAAHLLRVRFPADRQLFIDLHGHTPGRNPVTPAEALAGLLAAGGAELRTLPDDLDSRAGMWRDMMAGQRAVLVLDNAASSAQVAPLLPGGDRCLVLVTSRRHLADLPGPVIGVQLGVLSPGEARRMFLRLAPRAAAGPGEKVAELVTLAGFLPLAISLLARIFNRHSSWSLADLAAETKARLLTLTAERDSVAAAFALSYQYLDRDRRRFFGRLSLHPGATTDAYAAAALGGTELAAAALALDALHAEGLLTETGYRRYGMHDLIRRYAADRAAADPPAAGEQALGRLLDYYQHTAARADALLARQARSARAAPAPARPAAAPDLPDETQALAWAQAERASLLSCLDYAARAGQPARTVGLTDAMTELLRRDGPWDEAVARHAAAAQAARELGDRPGLASALQQLGDVRRLTGDTLGAAEALSEALGLFRELADRRGQANALSDLGMLQRATGDSPAADRLLREALGMFRELGDRRGQADALHGLGDVRRLAGDYPEADRALGEALVLFRELGDRRGEGNVVLLLGCVRLETGDHAAAARAVAGSLSIFRATGSRLGQANALDCLGSVRRATGDQAGAARDLEEALDIYRSLGNRRGQAVALNDLGAVRRATGDQLGARRALGEALVIFRDIGERFGQASTLNQTGDLHRACGDLNRARDSYRQALSLAREATYPEEESSALAGLGRCALADGDAAAAAASLRQAHAIAQRTGSGAAAGLAAELDAMTRPGVTIA